MRMLRKQVYLDQRHDRMLKRAKERGVTEAEVIRDILDRAEAGLAAAPRQQPDFEAGRKLIASIRALAGQRPRSRSAARRSWTRESLYEDRIGRWAKS